MIEKELVWQELSLDSLLTYEESLERQFDQKLLKNKPEVIKKHHKMLNKPTYAVVMDRYHSAPHKPKVITSSKLNELADPVLGKLTHHERMKLEQYNGKALPYKLNYHNQATPGKKRIEVPNHRLEEDTNVRESQQLVNFGSPTAYPYSGPEISENSQSATKLYLSSPLHGAQALLSPIVEENSANSKLSKRPEVNSFLTDLEDSGNNHNFIEANIKSNKNSFSSILRNRIQQATKLNKLLQPLDLQDINQQSPVKGRFDDHSEDMSSMNIKKQPVPNQKSYLPNGTQRKANLKKKIAEVQVPNPRKGIQFGKQQEGMGKRMKGSSSSNLYQDPLTKKVKKLKSSGYAVEVKRYTNQPKPIQKTKSQPGFFLTADDNQSTEDEQSVKARMRERLKNRLSYNPPKVNPIRQKREASKERVPPAGSNQPLKRVVRNSGKSLQDSRQQRANRVNGSRSRSQQPDPQVAARDKSVRRSASVSKFNNSTSSKNYSEKRGSSSVPNLLRQKVQQNRAEMKRQSSTSSLQSNMSTNSKTRRKSATTTTKAKIENHLAVLEGVSNNPSNPDEVLPSDKSEHELHSIISRLQSIEQAKSFSSKFQEPKNKPSDASIQDKQMTSLLKKHAEKLNQYLSDAQVYLDEYQQMKEL